MDLLYEAEGFIYSTDYTDYGEYKISMKKKKKKKEGKMCLMISNLLERNSNMPPTVETAPCGLNAELQIRFHVFKLKLIK